MPHLGRRHNLCNTYFPTNSDLLFLLLYFLLHVIVFFCYYQEYDWENGKDTLKDVGLALGHCTHVAAALHLLPVMRNSPLWLLLGKTNINLSHNYVVGWHMFNGYIILFFVTIHMFSFHLDWIIKGDQLLTNTSTSTTNIWVYNALTNEECWEEYGACLGELAWLSSVFLLLFALGPIRRACYYVFLYTHWIFFLTFFIFGGLHDPQLIWWCLPEFILYLIDWFCRGYRITEVKLVPYLSATPVKDQLHAVDRFKIKRAKNANQTASLLFSGNISGKFVYLNVPSVSKREWHPFSLCAGSSKKGTADVIIRPHGNGSWTDLVLRSASVGTESNTLLAYSSGMYGSITTMTSSTVVFIAGGVGFTALAPMIKHAVMGWETMHCDRPIFLREIIIVWAVRKEEDLNWFQKDLNKYQQHHGSLKLSIHLFVTGGSDDGKKHEIKSTSAISVGMSNKCDDKDDSTHAAAVQIGSALSMPNNKKVRAIHIAKRRPDLKDMLEEVCKRSTESWMDVFVCGPAGMRKSVLVAAAASTTGPTMLIHDETFEL